MKRVSYAKIWGNSQAWRELVSVKALNTLCPATFAVLCFQQSVAGLLIVIIYLSFITTFYMLLLIYSFTNIIILLYFNVFLIGMLLFIQFRLNKSPHLALTPRAFLCACAGSSNRHQLGTLPRCKVFTTFWLNILFPYIFGLNNVPLYHTSYYFYLYCNNSPYVKITYFSIYAYSFLFLYL